MILSAFLLLLGAALGAPAPAAEVVVSAGRGDDAAAGTAEAPVRTVTRGLELARERDAGRVQLEYGEYADGESFPLELPPGLELAGIGAGGTTLRADGGVLLRVAPSATPARTVLAGLTLAGADVGLDAAASPLADDAAAPGGAPVELVLRGVDLADCGVGLRATADRAPAKIEAVGLRARGCGRGVDLAGHGAFTLRLADSSFERCEVGLLLRAAEDGEAATYDGPPVRHDLALVRTAFVDCSRAGIERRGAAGVNDGPPYRLDDCLFRGNRAGIDLQRPAADTPFEIRGTRFHANAGFGLRATGQNGDPETQSLVEGCDFRWNGVGLHVTNSQVVCTVRRSRFVDNVGNALFVSNFMTDRVRVRIESSLFAGNGGAGIYTMADGERLACEILHCTVVGNGAAGVHRKTRHSGESRLEVRGSIVWSNRPDLERVEPDEVFASLIGDGSGGTARGNLAGAPGFVDAALRDYRLAPGSPCVDAAPVDPRLSARDLAGEPRRDAPDLGAFERVP